MYHDLEQPYLASQTIGPTLTAPVGLPPRSTKLQCISKYWQLLSTAHTVKLNGPRDSLPPEVILENIQSNVRHSELGPRQEMPGPGFLSISLDVFRLPVATRERSALHDPCLAGDCRCVAVLEGCEPNLMKGSVIGIVNGTIMEYNAALHGMVTVIISVKYAWVYVPKLQTRAEPRLEPGTAWLCRYRDVAWT